MSIRSTFWNGRFFQSTPEWAVFELGGNAFCLLTDLATDEQAQKLVAHHEAEARGVALPSSFPNYPEHTVSIFLRSVGLAHYHNGLVWPWFSFFFSAAMQHRGLGPSRDHAALEELIVRDGAILEVYERDGSPVVGLYFQSERDFSAACGTYLFAS